MTAAKIGAEIMWGDGSFVGIGWRPYPGCWRPSASAGRERWGDFVRCTWLGFYVIVQLHRHAQNRTPRRRAA